MDTINYSSIGIIHSPFRERVGTPRQAAGARDIEAQIEIFEKFRDGLDDLDGYSHVVVVFHMHLIAKYFLSANPPWDTEPRGLFSTCSPHRPNPIGVSVVKLNKIQDGKLYISGVDMVDQTPVLDIKPYVLSLYPHGKNGEVKMGWIEGKEELMNRSKAG